MTGRNLRWNAAPDAQGLYAPPEERGPEVACLEKFCSLMGWQLFLLPALATIDGYGVECHRVRAVMELKRRACKSGQYAEIFMSKHKVDCLWQHQRGNGSFKQALIPGYYVYEFSDGLFYIDLGCLNFSELKLQFMPSAQRPEYGYLVPTTNLRKVK